MRIHEFHYPKLFEINFNDPKLENVLDSKIDCGFEAETIWTSIEQSGFDPEYDELYWTDVEDEITAREHNNIMSEYRDWIISHRDYSENLDELRSEWVNNNYSEYYKDFVDERGLDDEWTEWSEENEDSSVGDFVEENYEDDYRDFVDELSYEEDLDDEAFERTTKDNDVDDYARYEYGSVYDMLRYLTSYEPEEGSIEKVGDVIEAWTNQYSEFRRVKTGDYHSGQSSPRQNYWRVESDASIDEDEGVGAEIISPVYETPRQMLEEMKSLFKFFNENGVMTNTSAGLHVTMSWTEEHDVEENKLKMVVLLGDQYLLKQFNREYNTYTKSQYKNVQDAVSKLSSDINSRDSIEKLENALSDSISREKYSAVNFKNLYNDYGNKLIEFRIMGDDDYEKDMKKIEKTVMRYAVIMNAGYSDEYHKDYIKALIRLFTKKSKLDPEIEKSVEKEFSYATNQPLFKNMRNIISSGRFESYTEAFNNAYEWLNAANEIEKESGQPQLFEDDGDEVEPTWQQRYNFYLGKAQDSFIRTIILLMFDLIEKETRRRVDVQTLYMLRKELPKFKLDYEQVWNKVSTHETIRHVFGRGTEGSRKIKHVLDSLLGKNNTIEIPQPKFTISFNPNVDRLFVVTDIWDAVDQGRQVDIKPEHFIQVNREEYDIAVESVKMKNTYSRSLTQLKNQLEYQYRQREEETDETYLRNIDKYIGDLEKNIQTYERGIKEATDTINYFLKNNGFIPDPDGEHVLPVNLKFIDSLHDYNIEIKAV